MIVFLPISLFIYSSNDIHLSANEISLIDPKLIGKEVEYSSAFFRL